MCTLSTNVETTESVDLATKEQHLRRSTNFEAEEKEQKTHKISIGRIGVHLESSNLDHDGVETGLDQQALFLTNDGRSRTTWPNCVVRTLHDA